MKTKFLIPTAVLLIAATPAYAGGGWLRDVLADTLHDAGHDLIMDGVWNLTHPTPSPTVVIPAPAYAAPAPAVMAPAPVIQPDAGAAYTAWLSQRLPARAALYNRPCTFSDGVRVTPVPCPVPGAQAAPIVQTALAQPEEEPVPVIAEEGPDHYYVGGRRYYRRGHTRTSTHFIRPTRSFGVTHFQSRRPTVAYRASVHWKKH